MILPISSTAGNALAGRDRPSKFAFLYSDGFLFYRGESDTDLGLRIDPTSVTAQLTSTLSACY